MEQKRGFVHDMLDIKVLILYALAQLPGPVEDFSVLAELCLVDDGVSYFELGEAFSSLCATGHVTEAPEGTIVLTDQGRQNGLLTQDSLAAPLRQKVNEAVDACLRRRQREQQVQTDLQELEDGTFLVKLHLSCPAGDLMALELPVESRSQARQLQKALFDRAEGLYAKMLDYLLAEAPVRNAPEKAVDKQGFMG